MKLGISSWTYPWAIGVPGYPQPERALDTAQLLAKAHELGAEVVQIADNLPLHDLSDRQLRELRQESEGLGLTLEVGTRGIHPDHLRRYLEIAQALNATVLRTLVEGPDATPDLDQAKAWLWAVLPAFESAGVRIALENHGKHRVRDLAALVSELRSSSAGICLDTANNLSLLETPAEVVRALAPVTINLHVKDFGISRIDCMMGFSVLGRPAGRGLVEVEAALRAVAEYGHPGANVILEQWPPYLGNLPETVRQEEQWAAEGLVYLRHLLAKLGL